MSGSAFEDVLIEETSERSESTLFADDSAYSHLTPLLQEFANGKQLEDLGDSSQKAAQPRSSIRDRLVTEFLPIAQHIAQRYVRRGVPLEDLTQVAAVGLINSIDRYDPARGISFLAFAVPTIQGEIRRHFRDRAWSMRVPRGLKELHLKISKATNELSSQLGRAPRPSELAEHLNVRLEEILEGLQASNAYTAFSLDSGLDDSDSDWSAEAAARMLGAEDPGLARVEIQHTVMPMLATLPKRERDIVVLRFYANMTQSQIATRVGMSQMHVSRLLARALKRLREGQGDQPSD